MGQWVNESSLIASVVRAAKAIEAAGVSADEARRDAVLLAQFAVGWDAPAWLARQRDPPPAGFETAFDALVRRRAAREPMSHIRGGREFYGRWFEVTADVLTPRPETEGLVDAVLALRATTEHAPTIVDVGTGSGCIAVTLALEWPGAQVIATDVSPAALYVAAKNALRHDVADRIDFRRGSLTAGAPGPVDVIVSNPPYVAESDRASLPPEVARFDPALALYGGADGLDVVRALLIEGAKALAPGGAIAIEIGAGQAPQVSELARAAGFENVRMLNDLAGIPRVMMAQRI